MRNSFFVLLFISISFIGCDSRNSTSAIDSNQACDSIKTSNKYPAVDGNEFRGALLASRINSLEELKKIIKIEYVKENYNSKNGEYENCVVRLTHCNYGKRVVSILKSGISQTDIIEARDGNINDKVNLVLESPFAISTREDLRHIYFLARRFDEIFGVGDKAFYHLAEAAVQKISSKEAAYKISRDSSSNGYINSFNHITAQAFITAIYSEETADFVADVHELKNMKELACGVFTEEQLMHQANNPVDNYVDMINNEWGQEVGKKLKRKYKINRLTKWTPELLTNFLNDLQEYYSLTFQIELDPFHFSEEVIQRFYDKMNCLNDDGSC